MSCARVIVNLTAGAGRAAREWQHISHLLKNIGLSFEHDITESPGHAIELAKSAAEKGYQLVVSVGGDGTINEIVNGLYDSGGIKDITLGIISTGTGSDYVRSFGLDHRFQEACQRLVNPRKLLVDIGVAEYARNGQKAKRLFVNCAGLGFDAEIVKATTQRFKALGGKPAYLAGLLTTFLLYRNRAVTLSVDGKTEERKVCTVLVSKGKYTGGSMLVAPQADPADGFFDVLIIEELSKADLLWSLPRIYRGTHLTHPRVTLKKAQEVQIQSIQQTFFQADGELLGETPVRFQVLPAMLNLAV
ncbi:diacylglycerol/lipid kinase family protein [Chloroflexota bacterium]